MPLKANLHEPHHSIQSLTPYEHLHHLFRLCSNHYHRNITSCGVTQEVKGLMYSLLCLKLERGVDSDSRKRRQGRKWCVYSLKSVFPCSCSVGSRSVTQQGDHSFCLRGHLLGAKFHSGSGLAGGRRKH
ncbi:hypothetical protein C8F04DRAFT_73461 [Mycena alexandri]|uniref:Uncharacterized protein n=1 Tax=Mycena alexandri TaxID=1745969 RepID=A0AAD6WWL0_9AGAR|nr:hypothetical protein C8F04DRAFT_73461 [Mycena alexandri]